MVHITILSLQLKYRTLAFENPFSGSAYIIGWPRFRLGLFYKSMFCAFMSSLVSSLLKGQYGYERVKMYRGEVEERSSGVPKTVRADS